jgi:hypothetical protein
MEKQVWSGLKSCGLGSNHGNIPNKKMMMLGCLTELND